MPFTISTARVRYAHADAPIPLHDPPVLGYLVHVDLARERITARVAFPEDLSGHHVGGLAPVPLPCASPGFPDFALALPPACAEAVEAWLMGVLAPLAETIRTGTLWEGPIDRHDADPVQRAVAGFTTPATDALTELAEAQSAAWDEGLDTAAVVPEPWRAYTWCHARVHDAGEDRHGLLGGFTVGDARYLRSAEGGQIRQWWSGTTPELARLLVETTPAWAHRPHRAHRNRGLAVLVWEELELVLEVPEIEDGKIPGPDAVAQAPVTNPA